MIAFVLVWRAARGRSLWRVDPFGAERAREQVKLRATFSVTNKVIEGDSAGGQFEASPGTERLKQVALPNVEAAI